MTKMICFDMDGTIADLYGVHNWLEMLRAEDSTPYALAEYMWDMKRLAEVLNILRNRGWEVRIITWLSKDSTEAYKDEVRRVKREWLENCGFPFDHFHAVQYGVTKADSIRRYADYAILFDDNRKVRNGWHMGVAIDPTTINIIEYLENFI